MNFLSDPNVSSTSSSSPMFYEHNNVKYIHTFPEEWATSHVQGTGPIDCKSCKDWGMWNGIFLGYCKKCANCPYTYGGSRGSGFHFLGELEDPFNYDSVHFVDEEHSIFVDKNNQYLESIVIEDIPTGNGEWISTQELLDLNKKRGEIMEKTCKIFYMSPTEHGENYTCSLTTPFAEFVVYHVGYIEECLQEDEKIALELPSAWRDQKIPNSTSNDGLTAEEESLYYERVEYIVKKYNYKQGNYDINYIFRRLKEMPEKAYTQEHVEIDYQIAKNIKQKLDEDAYYAMINAYCDELADCPPEWPGHGESSYGSHYEEGYDSF